MKVVLSTEAETALGDFIERLRKLKSDISGSRSIAVNQIILEYAANANTAQMEALVERLVSPGKRRSGLRKYFAELTSLDNPDALDELERVLKKHYKKRDFEPKSTAKSEFKTFDSSAKSTKNLV